MDSAYFSGRSGDERNCFPNSFFLNLDPLCCPVAAKPLVLELFMFFSILDTPTIEIFRFFDVVHRQ